MKKISEQIKQLLKQKVEPDYVRETHSHGNLFSWDLCPNSLRIRLVIVVCFFVLSFLAISYNLIVMASKSYHKPQDYTNRKNGFRKEIVDRNGTLLACTVPSSSLFANPTKVVDPEQSIEKLSTIVPNLDKQKLLAELKSNRTFVWVKRDITPKEQVEIFNLGLPGFSFEREEKRIYTFGNLLSHVIGYVGRDSIGLAGIEKNYDDFLSNNKNLASTEKRLELSIDVRLQNILDEEMTRVLKEFSAKGAVGIIADPNSGEILAMVSKPDFDPHYPGNANSKQLFNMASLGIYEIGSVFKAITIAIGLDTKAISMNDAYDLSYMKIGKFVVKDYHPMHSWHTVPEIFLHSSNIGVSQIILEIGKENFKKYLKNLQLLEQLTLELPERGTPLFPQDNRWNDLSMATMSYGYGLSVSPLHFVQAMLPVVNGGYLYPVTLIKQNGTKPLVGNKIFSDETSKEMRKLLRLVVKEGTGRKAEVNGYFIGGKTGTANKATGGHYASNSRISSFFGILPSSKPKYAIYIMFDEPKGTKETFGFATAGYTAAPAVGRVFERIIALYGIDAMDENDSEIKDILDIEYKIKDEI